MNEKSCTISQYSRVRNAFFGPPGCRAADPRFSGRPRARGPIAIVRQGKRNSSGQQGEGRQAHRRIGLAPSRAPDGALRERHDEDVPVPKPAYATPIAVLMRVRNHG